MKLELDKDEIKLILEVIASDYEGLQNYQDYAKLIEIREKLQDFVNT